MNVLFRITIFSLATLSLACSRRAEPSELLQLNESQMKIRSYQTRTFDIADRDRVLRCIMVSLQDLDFVLERANGPMGMVTAGKFERGGVMEMTVVVRAKGEKQTEVRANALFNTRPVEDPKAYQNFFTVLQRSLFVAGPSSDVTPATNP
ncbi:MAG: hypothetical protein ACOC95_03960 [Planctomycetota bacterium]